LTIFPAAEQFSTNTGLYPGGLIQGKDGNFYGVCNSDGANEWGTIFQITLSSNGSTATITVIHAFSGNGSDGSGPVGDLTEDPSTGNLYGACSGGGTGGFGCIFRVNYNAVNNSYSVNGNGTIYSFPGGSETSQGGNPAAGLVVVNGTLYGTTFSGGTESLQILT